MSIAIITGVLLTAFSLSTNADPLMPPSSSSFLEKALFAGGCFWCMEPPFDELEGVLSTTSGYTGGHTKSPNYEEVSAGKTGHTEAVEVLYDPRKVSYDELLSVFWKNIDPTTNDRQFCDHGKQYRTGIYPQSENQMRLAKTSLSQLEKTKPFRDPILTEIVLATPFFPAEDYHQDFYKRSPVRYKFYRFNCGRDKRLKELWG